MTRLRYLGFSCLLLMMMAVGSRASAQSKVAVVDIQRALLETEDGRQAKAKLKSLFDSRQKSLDSKQTALQQMKESIEKQKSVLSRDALRTKLEEYQKALMELQTVYLEYQKELAAKEGELTKDIVARMRRILRRIGQRDGYALVLEKNEAGVIFVPSNLDLTDLLIQRYNAGEGREERENSAGGKKKAKGKSKAK